MAISREPGLATIPKRRAAARIIRCCASRLIARSFGTARCDRAILRPTPEWFSFFSVAWPRCRRISAARAFVFGPIRDSSAASSSEAWKIRAWAMLSSPRNTGQSKSGRGRRASTSSRAGSKWPSFDTKPHGWPKARRFVVMRRPIPEDPVEAKQLTLFKDRRYGYSVFVTNLDLEPWRIWKFYQPRAVIEKNIRELLYDLPLGKIPSGDWVANVAFFQLVLFACNLVHWFRRLCLPAPYRTATVETVRTDFLVLPARLVSRAGRNVLQLPKDYFHRDAFVTAFQKAAKLRLPKTIRFCK